MFWNIVLDSLLDTLKILPFLVAIYILIELLERKTSFASNQKLLQGAWAPLIGTATGIIPQCGFSVMAAKLYDKGYIRVGTLLAVFLATSDEAIIILLSGGTSAVAVMPLVLIKLVVGLSVGFLVNFLFRKQKLQAVPAREDHDHDHGTEHEEGDIETYSCGREHKGKKAVRIYFVDPLLHSLKIALYLFLVTLAFGLIIDRLGGEEALQSTLIGGKWGQPFLAALVGLIPTCASSVIITGAYMNGGILFGSCVAGLCANAGLGVVVLLKNTKKWKRNIAIVLSLYLIASLVGLAVNGIMTAFSLI